MKLLNNIKMKAKLLGIFLFIGLIPLTTVAILSTKIAESALKNQAFQKLQAVQKIKYERIKKNFTEAVHDVNIYASNSALVLCSQRFINAFETNKTTSQKQWEKWALFHGPKLHMYKKAKRYYDILIISNHGDIVYSDLRNVDLGQNIYHGPLSNSGLSEAVQKGKDKASLTDYQWYPPAKKPISFVTGPIYDANNQLIGVLVYLIDANYTAGLIHERAGMGESGETYIVGQDKRMRSNSTHDIVGRSMLASYQGNIDENGINTETAQKALAGETGIEISSDYNHTPVLTAYTPLNLFGIQWAVISQMDLSEVKAPLIGLIRTIFILALIIVILITVFALFMSNNLTAPLIESVSLAQKISENDLTATDLNFDAEDELGDLGRALDLMKNHLTNIIYQIKSNTEQVVCAANEISSTSSQMASGAEEQNNQATEVATAMQQMAAAITQNSQNATLTAQNASETAEKAQKGAEAMQETKTGMEQIIEATNKTKQVITALSHRAEEIGNVISVINDIADQTNLLALNAAIEAARAGEQGRGFAVVADEVRKLAERTTHATKEISSTIEAIQNDTQNASNSMQEAIVIIDTGKEATDRTETVLADIILSINSALDMISQIATASEQQSSGAEQITKNVDAISSVTQQSAAAAEEMASAANQLNREAELLHNLVGQFSVNSNGNGAQQQASKLSNGEISETTLDKYGYISALSIDI